MTSPRRLTDLAELDVEAERIVEVLEDALEAIPTLIFLIKCAQALARRELREADEAELALTGDRRADSVSASAPQSRRQRSGP